MRPTPIPPGPGQESVWDYPRPPRIERSDRHIVVTFGGVVVAETRRAVRVLETSHPPSYYLPLDDCTAGAFVPAAGSSFCEWKGVAGYYSIVAGDQVAERTAWCYPDPTPRFAAIVDHVSLYPGRVDRCTIDGELVRAQHGGFYGGWITDEIVGPFKGGPGTSGW
jgi:uncharacterized protein (DUF427 family)